MALVGGTWPRSSGMLFSAPLRRSSNARRGVLGHGRDRQDASLIASSLARDLRVAEPCSATCQRCPGESLRGIGHQPIARSASIVDSSGKPYSMHSSNRRNKAGIQQLDMIRRRDDELSDVSLQGIAGRSSGRAGPLRRRLARPCACRSHRTRRTSRRI